MRTATNWKQRVSAILLAIAMVVVTVLTGLAAIPAKAATTSAKLRLTGVEKNLGNGKVWAYPIVLDATDDAGNHYWKYGTNRNTNSGANGDMTTDINVSQWLSNGASFTQQQLINIYTNLNTDSGDNAHNGRGNAVVQDANTTGQNALVVELDEDTNNLGQYVSTTNITPGLYVIAVNAGAGSSTSYNFTLAAVNYTYGTDGQVSGIKGGTSSASSPVNGEIVVNVKSSNSPTLTKEVIDENGDASKHGDANIGDTINFRITVHIPEYASDWQTANLHYQITDTLTAGLALNQDSIRLKESEATTDAVAFTSFKQVESSKITFNETDGQPDFVIDLFGNDVYNHKNKDLVITYTATVNEKAGVNFDEETNTAQLLYTNTPGNDDLSKPVEDKTHHYTFGFDTTLNGENSNTTTEITKFGLTATTSTTKVKLSGAQFQLFEQTDESYANPLHFTPDGKYTKDTTAGNILTSGAQGQLTATGLDAGSYFLKEYKAPEGYALDSTPIPVVIAPTYNDAGELVSYTVSVGDASKSQQIIFTNTSTTSTSSSGDSTYAINNTPLSTLPATGGRGIIIVTIIAAIMMAGFGSAFIMLKNGKAKKN